MLESLRYMQAKPMPDSVLIIDALNMSICLLSHSNIVPALACAQSSLPLFLLAGFNILRSISLCSPVVLDGMAYFSFLTNAAFPPVSLSIAYS